MARSEITQEQVNHIAETIKVNGSKPSARLVREKLGGVGSTTTILKYLQVWQAGQAKPVAKDVLLPVALSKYLLEFMAKEVEDGKESLQEDLFQIQQAQADLIVESERQVVEIEVLSSEAELAQSNNAVLVSQLESVKTELTKVSEEALIERKAAELARTDVTVLTVKLNAVEARIDVVVNDLALAQQAKVSLTSANESQANELKSQAKTIEALNAEKAVLDSRLDNVKAELVKLASEATVERKALELARTDVAVASVKLNATEAIVVAVKLELEAARLAAKVAGEEAAELRGRLNAVAINEDN